jgi:hypothetical protein
MSDQLTFHVDYDDAGGGWTHARLREVPAAIRAEQASAMRRLKRGLPLDH